MNMYPVLLFLACWSSQACMHHGVSQNFKSRSPVLSVTRLFRRFFYPNSSRSARKKAFRECQFFATQGTIRGKFFMYRIVFLRNEEMEKRKSLNFSS